MYAKKPDNNNKYFFGVLPILLLLALQLIELVGEVSQAGERRGALWMTYTYFC